MKVKHNKKRNTAFVFEALVKEATVAVLKKEKKRKNAAVKLINKHFKVGTVLRKDLDCYRSLYESTNLDRPTSEKILKEAKLQRYFIKDEALFEAQTSLIHDVNKDLSPDVFGNFVPNYKSLATISQIFSSKISPKNQIILENEMIGHMMLNETPDNELTEVDDVVYRTFVKKFNDKYHDNLLKEQKDLLTCYITSFVDNSLELKMFLNEEITRLKSSLINVRKNEMMKEDSDMDTKTQQVIEKLESYATASISESLLLSILKTQQLVKEIHSDGHND
jgi:hypothetical protein